jgi:hypothetical protein
MHYQVLEDLSQPHFLRIFDIPSSELDRLQLHQSIQSKSLYLYLLQSASKVSRSKSCSCSSNNTCSNPFIFLLSLNLESKVDHPLQKFVFRIRTQGKHSFLSNYFQLNYSSNETYLCSPNLYSIYKYLKLGYGFAMSQILGCTHFFFSSFPSTERSIATSVVHTLTSLPDASNVEIRLRSSWIFSVKSSLVANVCLLYFVLVLL